MPAPHKHAEVIHAFADGAKVQVRLNGAEHWQETKFPDFCDECEYRIKPEPAAPKWPQTTMAEDSILSAWYNGNDVRGPSAEIWAMIRVANAAIAHACETGALVPADKVREIEAKARAEGAKSALDPIDVIEATWRHLKSFPVSREDIQIILLKAAK